LLKVVFLVAAGLLPAVSFADELPAGLKAINGFGNTIYQMAERTGGSPAEWDRAEADLLAQLQSLRAQGQLQPTQMDGKGRTLLIHAAMNGYAFVVSYLLNLDEVQETLDVADKQGLTAFAHSQLALRQTLLACFPDVEQMNPFVAVPFLVKQPYYQDRAPYPRIAQMLAGAGAATGVEAARAMFLDRCETADPALRAEVATAGDLQSVLFGETRKAKIRACEREAQDAIELVESLAPEGKPLDEKWQGLLTHLQQALSDCSASDVD
jgi:hypothetical protein